MILHLEISISINVSSIITVNGIDDALVKMHNINIKNCDIGEVYYEKLGTCEMCSAGSYSFNPNDTECSICPKEAINCVGDEVNLKPKYWISKQTLKIYECFPFAESCM